MIQIEMFTVPKVICPPISVLALRNSGSSDIQGGHLQFQDEFAAGKKDFWKNWNKPWSKEVNEDASPIIAEMIYLFNM